MKPLLLSVLVSTLAACGRPPTPAKLPAAGAPAAHGAATPTPAARVFQSTAALVTRPDVQILVDDLASSARMASASVGYDGHKSAEYTKFERLRAVATDVELTALLDHESPGVRSYAAQHVIDHDLDAPSLGGLLADQTSVSTQYGCLNGVMPVAWITVQSLCAAQVQPRASKRLHDLAGQSGDLADQARRCLTLP